MGGHGGLNILPQKEWNVYNFDNREKVKNDEEAAAKQEQIKRQQSRKRDTELRLKQLRQARGSSSSSSTKSTAEHINLFEGIRIFDPIKIQDTNNNKSELVLGNELRRGLKRMRKEAEAPPKEILPEDEKYRLGHGLAGKGVKLPWYMTMDKQRHDKDKQPDDEEMLSRKKTKNKSVAELREERLNREAKEKQRERASQTQNIPRE